MVEQTKTQKKSSILKQVSMIFGIILIVALIIYLAFVTRNAFKEYDYIGKTAETENEITISGQAEIVAVPDIATVSLTVISENLNVTKAQTENTQKMNSIISAMKDLGIEEKDLKTTSYNIYPQYDWTEDGRIFKGYQVNQSLSVKIRETEKVSQVLAKAGELKVNSVSELRFEIDDVESIEQQARIKAIDNAKQKAEEIADALDVKLGKVISFSESSYVPTVRYDYAKTEAIGLGVAEEAPDIQVGENEVTSYVTVTFELL